MKYLVRSSVEWDSPPEKGREIRHAAYCIQVHIRITQGVWST